jgi:hypothetical protein
MVTFATNALSAFNRMGFVGELLEGESLAEVTTACRGRLTVDESLPLVVTGRAPAHRHRVARVTVSLRTIPIRNRGSASAIVLCRDATESATRSANS